MSEDWRQTYQHKLTSAAEAAMLVKSGDTIYSGGFSALPYDFIEALGERRDELEDVDYFGCMAPYPFRILDGDCKGHINYFTFFTGGFERVKAPQGNIEQLSVHLGELDRFMRQRVKPDILAVNVSPPDKHGWMTFGPLGGMAMHTAKCLAKQIIVTVQETQPRISGESNALHVSEVDAIIETDVPIPNLPGAEPTDVDREIARHVAPLVPDGATVQIGIGSVPGAVAHNLADKKDLGIHTELLTDDMFQLVKAGAVTGEKKNIYPGKIVYGFAAGSTELLDFLDDNPQCVIRPVSETVDPHLCGQNDNFVSINTCLLVSITGAVAAEAVNFTQVSGTGGQLDLVRAARNSSGGVSVIVFPSTRALKSGEVISNVVLALPPGTPVTTPRTDVEYLATEYGVVNLRYKSNLERARAMISIAHPDFRDELRSGIVEMTHIPLEALS